MIKLRKWIETMDDKIEDIEVDLESGSELEIQEDGADQERADQGDEEAEFFDKSYMYDDRKSPSFILVGIVILLIAFVFVKKFMASRVYQSTAQVEQIVKDKTK